MMATMNADPLAPKSPSEEVRYRRIGFRWGDKGTHTSRTIMHEELRALLSLCPQEATREDYLKAVLEDNCLGKRTAATRRLTFQRLSELYALSPEVTLFRIMRQHWPADPDGQPLLALLLALARDPLLRATAPSILSLRPGEELARPVMQEALSSVVRGRLSDSTLAKVVRNAASSWTQSGHLSGRGRKIRQAVHPTPASTAYALLLGFLTGTRGEGLFQTPWARILDAPVVQLIDRAVDARRLGFLDMSQSGGVVEVSFGRLLAADEGR
ncbi:MAG: hypothetical protein D8M59_08900 [Planctomycetes bacterium]|nr:hypothetical protein [Planctomycetota bacterium]NOG54178.1 hypothetical protein [Planctomycetota bacterium]